MYDVTAGRESYSGTGGYAFFSGVDAARAYVTGCFKTHLTHDIRGFGKKEIRVRLFESRSRDFATSHAGG